MGSWKERNDVIAAMLQINALRPNLFNFVPSPSHTALLVLPGPDSHAYRIWQAKRVWEGLGGLNAEYFLCAGRREEPSLTREYAAEKFGLRVNHRFHFQGYAAHTKAQMEWVLSQLVSFPGVRHIVVCTAAYHAPRCFLTLLQELQEVNHPFRYILSTIPLFDPESPVRDFTGLEETGSTGPAGEIQRIQEYAEKGDVAGKKLYLEYLVWRLHR